MIKSFSQQYQGMSQDITLTKTNDKKYYSARNLRVTAVDKSTTMAIINEKGNEMTLTIPIPALNTTSTSITYTVNTVTKSLPYKTSGTVIPRCQIETEFNGKTSGDQKIIGIQEARDSAIIITTDDNGWDCVWEFTDLNSGSYGLTLLYMNNLGLSTSKPVQIIYNYENSIIEKIYFADGEHQLRYMNLRQAEVNGDIINLADMDPTAIDTVSNFSLSQPIIENVVGGGTHTSGMIQYAYGLYVLNGSQTGISPISELVPIDKGSGLGGGEVNENLGKAVLVNISNIDQDYTHIKIYSIKYTSYNGTPEISVIADKEIDNYSSMQYFDNGSIKYNISLEQFAFLGSSPKVPKHIESKENRMFLFNVKEQNFVLEGVDTRAYSHNNLGNAVIWENLSYNGNSVVGSSFNVPADYNVPTKHDAINKDYNVYKYQSDGTTLGGEGKYIKYRLKQAGESTIPDYKKKRFFKDNELYRIGIQFYNGLGLTTEPLWIADFVAPSGNMVDFYNHLEVTIKPELITYFDSQTYENEASKPVGYKILRADRNLSDRTIIASGMLNSMVANLASREKRFSFTDRKSKAESPNAKKIPSLTRVFTRVSPMIEAIDYALLTWEAVRPDPPSDSTDIGRGQHSETHKGASSSDWRAQSFQFNKLIQMFSPEISFSDVTTDSSMELEVRGMCTNNNTQAWATEEVPGTGVAAIEAKYANGLNRFSGVETSILGKTDGLMDSGIFGPTDSKTYVGLVQHYRDFTGGFSTAPNLRKYTLAGSPEVTERGAEFTNYNGDARLRYANNLIDFLQDDFRRSSDVNTDAEQQILGCNSDGERCITLMQGTGLENSLSLEGMYAQSGIILTNGVLYADLKRPEYTKYVGGYYGGMNYESKTGTSYVSIGSYKDLSDTTITIESPGDTYVHAFKFTKLAQSTTNVTDRSFNQLTEIVEFNCETTINLENRDDLSLEAWDNRWQPTYDEYMVYNRVYSQQPNLLNEVGTGFKYKQVSEFDARIIASKEKIAGENIDSWTDYLENEQKDLDGKYGPINAVINYKDEIFTFQDEAVARISINPRVQTTGSDGLEIELGTGGVIHDYHYMTTKSGCLNKWGVIATDNGFYYADVLNKAMMQGNMQQIQNLGDMQGMHSFFLNNITYDDLVLDLPNNSTGISMGYDPVNKDVYFSFHKSTDPFTISYNENMGAFISLHDFVPAYYINKGNRMLTTGGDETTLWEHKIGDEGNYYGVQYDTSIKFNINSQSQNSAIFNNIQYKTEVTDKDGLELPLRTLDYIQVYNEYQDTGFKKLVLRDNLKKRLRAWTAQIPRNLGTRDRIKSPYAFVEFTFVNANGVKLILQDINVFYTQY